MSLLKHFRNLRQKDSEKEPDEKAEGQAAGWLWGNYPLLKLRINNHLAVLMALAEMSQRKSEYLPKLSKEVLTRCPSIVKLLPAAATEDPATFERNNNPPFTDTPPRFSNYDDAISFWTCWLRSIEKYPYRIPVPNHLSEAHKWFWLTRDIDEGTGSSLLSRVEALIPFGQLDDIRLRSTEFTKDFHATHPSA